MLFICKLNNVSYYTVLASRTLSSYDSLDVSILLFALICTCVYTDYDFNKHACKYLGALDIH